MKPYWFHYYGEGEKLHTRIPHGTTVFMTVRIRNRSMQFFETTLVSSEIGVCNKISAGNVFWPDGTPLIPVHITRIINYGHRGGGGGGGG